jgi:hypothetical protein
LRAELRRIFDRAAALGGLALHWRPETAALALHALLTGLVHSWLRGTDFDLATEGAEPLRAFLASTRCGKGTLAR